MAVYFVKICEFCGKEQRVSPSLDETLYPLGKDFDFLEQPSANQ